MLRLRQQFSIPGFIVLLVTAIAWQGKAGGCLQAGRACPAPGQKRLGARGSLGAERSGCQGTRVSPRGKSQALLGVPGSPPG